MNRRKTLAREWLLLLGGILVGVAAVPALLALLFEEDLSIFYKTLLLQRPDWVFAWLITLAPYATVQVVRSVVWAVRVLRKPNSPTV